MYNTKETETYENPWALASFKIIAISFLATWLTKSLSFLFTFMTEFFWYYKNGVNKGLKISELFNFDYSTFAMVADFGNIVLHFYILYILYNIYVSNVSEEKRKDLIKK